MDTYFMYDPEGDGYQEYLSQEDALSAAKEAIGYYLDDGWSEDVESVVVGKITHRATQVNLVKRPPESEIDDEGIDGEGDWWDGDWEEKCNYELIEVKVEQD